MILGPPVVVTDGLDPHGDPGLLVHMGEVVEDRERPALGEKLIQGRAVDRDLGPVDAIGSRICWTDMRVMGMRRASARGRGDRRGFGPQWYGAARSVSFQIARTSRSPGEREPEGHPGGPHRPDEHPMKTPLHFSTLAVHAGRRPTPEDPDLAPPIRRATTFLQHPEVHGLRTGDWETPLVYSRYGSPNAADAEQVLAALEGAEHAVLFASGMAAIHAMLMHVFPGGRGRVALARQIYGGTSALFSRALAALGFEVTYFDVREAGELTAVLEAGAGLVHVEESRIQRWRSRTCRVWRIRRTVLAPSSPSTPRSQPRRPAAPGARGGPGPLRHKALAGHSDVTAGVVLRSAARMEGIAGYRKLTGAILDPAAAWLLRRSLSTSG